MKFNLLYISFYFAWISQAASEANTTSGEHHQLRKLDDPVCKGNRLLNGERLYRNEFLCSSSDSYRFGLDNNGILADRYGPALFSLVGDIIWSPTSTPGAYLHMQRDGNLVLYDDDGDVVWATDCYGDGAILMRSGSTWPNLYTVRPDRITEGAFVPEEDQIWRVNSDQSSTTCTPPIYCVGNTLTSTMKLYRDEYICPYGLNGELLAESYRFGVNNHQRLVLDAHGTTIWSAAKGDYLRMQADGNAVVRENGIAQWATHCRRYGNVLRLEDTGVFLRDVDGRSRWFVGFDGVESQRCNDEHVPTGQCDRVGHSSGVCRMRMIDHLNLNYVELEAKDTGAGTFEVTDNVQGSCGSDPWTVEVRLVGEDIEIGAGVPDVTCTEMVENYDVPLNDSQLDFLNVEGYPCTEFGMNLIWFMILQWFYFG